MNSIKTKTRNRLEIDHLDMLMRIKCFQSSEAQIDLDGEYWQWSSQDRREKLLKEKDSLWKYCRLCMVSKCWYNKYNKGWLQKTQLILIKFWF